MRCNPRGNPNLTLPEYTLTLQCILKFAAAQLALTSRCPRCPSSISAHTFIMTLAQLAAQVRKGQIDTVLVAFPDPFGRLMGMRFRADFFLESVAQSGTHGCNYLLTV